MASSRGTRSFPQLLVAKKVVPEDKLREILGSDEVKNKRLEEVLVSQSVADPKDVYRAKAEYLGVPFVDMDNTEIDEDVVNLLPMDLVERLNVVPIKRTDDGEGLIIAMPDPSDILVVDEVKRGAKVDVEPVQAIPAQIEAARTRVYGAVDREEVDEAVAQMAAGERITSEQVGRAGMDVDITTKLGGGGSEEEVAQSAPIIRIVNTLLRRAIQLDASDVHIEPMGDSVRVRYRIDGDLQEIMNPPKHVHAPLISRMKILADMDIAERRIPQDGRVRVRLDGKMFDLRVSTIPTVNGEKCVFRILDQSDMFLGLERLGFQTDTLATLEKLIKQPNGILLSTGPTGHGKTTTQFSILQRISTIDRNVMTIEEPVEYQLPGINQVAVNRKAGLTFATALRSFLRQDPDIILVGEIRDLETADIAIEASLTGHLVLSTLHTNNAPTAVTRLTDMGVEPFLISASVIGVLAQRLAKRVCENCKEEYEPAPDLLLAFDWDPESPPDPEQKFYRGSGCDICRQTGYKGRLGVFELMELDSEIRELIVRRAPLADIESAARSIGMRTLKDDAFDKVLSGATNPEEIIRKVMTAGWD
ncbi:MAG: type II secretion system protein GspE [Armatimonadia bacterium]|nr:type II secretion system protein GspE [Armatimonadia bacterium]